MSVVAIEEKVDLLLDAVGFLLVTNNSQFWEQKKFKDKRDMLVEEIDETIKERIKEKKNE